MFLTPCSFKYKWSITRSLNCKPLVLPLRTVQNYNRSVAPCKVIQPDSFGLWIPSRGFRTPGNGFWNRCQWNLDSGRLSLAASGFFELYSGFHSSGFWNLQGKFPRFLIPQAQMSLISESVFPCYSPVLAPPFIPFP